MSIDALTPVEFPIAGVLTGVLASLAMLLVLVFFKGGLEPLYRIALLRWSSDETVTITQAVVAFVLIGALGGLVFVILWPLVDADRPFGLYPSNALAAAIAGLIFILYVEVGGRYEKDKHDDMRRRLAWLVGAAMYAVVLSFGFGLVLTLLL